MVVPSSSPPGSVAGASVGGVQPLAASMSFAMTASAAQADPKDTVAFMVYFNNTGTQSAPNAWINVTAASGLTFAGDTAAGNVSLYPDYAFANLALGLHSFRMSFLVAVGTAPGSRLAVSSTLVYADGVGGQQFRGPVSASVLVGVVTKSLYLAWGSTRPTILTPVAPTGSLSAQGTFTLSPGGPSLSFDLTPALARPFRALNATAVLYLQPLTSSMSLDLNLSLMDVSGSVTNLVASVERTYAISGTGYWTLFYTFPSMDYVLPAGHQIRLQVLNTLASVYGALLATNATAEPSRIGLQTTTYVSVDSLQPTLSPTTYLSPRSSLVVTANVSDPFGSADILTAHANVTGPGGSVVTWSTAFPVVAVDPSSPSAWKLFRLTLPPLLQNGTYAVEITAVEANGVTDLASGGAVVRAPEFTLEKVASPTQGKSGTRITYSIWYNNTGSGPAGRVWLNDTLPSQVNFLSANPTPTSSLGSTYSWVFSSPSSVSVGSHLVTVSVQVKGGVSTISYIRNWATLNDTDPQGFLWTPLRSHADVVLNGPYLILSQTSAPSGGVHSNQSVVFSISLENTGDASPTVWMNDTIPTGLSYVSDTAGSVGASRTVVGNQVRWVFSNLPSGSSTPVYRNFTMTARAGAGLVTGLPLPNTIGLNETSTNGLLMPDQVIVLSLTVVSPGITAASVSFGVPSAVPNVSLPVYLNFTNAGNEAAGTTWVNLSLGTSLRFVNASVSASVSGTTLRIVLANASMGADSFPLFVAALPTVREGQVLSLPGTLRTSDGYGNLLPAMALAAGAVSVALPNVSFRIAPANLPAEAGTAISYAVTGGNSGTGIASAVWLNVTLPAGLDYVNDTFGAVRTGFGLNYSWHWSNYGPGPRSYTLVLAADAGAADGTSANFTFGVQAFDAGGNRETPSTFGGRVDFRAPSFQVSIWSDRNETQGSTPFSFTLIAMNTGSTTAHALWLTTTIDRHLSVVSYDGPVASGTSTLNWTYSDVTPGQTIVIKLIVRVVDGTPGNTAVYETVTAQYTNSVGVLMSSAPSATAEVNVPASWTGFFLIVLGGSAVGGLVVFLVYRRYRVRIEDVFLIYRDGILVSHLTQGDGLEKDEDQLSGMLTAVQDFVKDAFTYGEHRELHQLEFGDYHVLIERGKLVYLAVVYQGRDSGLIRKKVRAVLDTVESRFGPVFDAWDGDMGEVEATRDLLREGFVETKRPWSLVKSKPS